MSRTPLVSIVLPTVNAARTVARTLTSLCMWLPLSEVEIIVVDGSSDKTPDIVQSYRPDVELVRMEPGCAIPYLRGCGIARARGHIIALLDPYTRITRNWYSTLCRLHRELPFAVIGGAVDPHPTTLRHRASWWVYLAEYHAFMRPFPAGPVRDLAGNHVTYRREVLGDRTRFAREGFWKTLFNQELREHGHTLWCTPDLVVWVDKPIPPKDYLLDRFAHGRCFAARRAQHMSRPIRWMRACMSPGVPWVLWIRQIRAMRSKRTDPGKWVQSLPFLFACNTVWAWGELWGYIHGAGTSCHRLAY